MRHYLVATLDFDSTKSIEFLQRNIQRKYKISRTSSTFYIPLETLEDPNVEKLDNILKKLIKPYKKFKIELTGDLNYHDYLNKSASLRIENKGYIKKLHRSLNDMLKLHGFSIRENIDSPLFMPLSFNSLGKPIKKSEPINQFLPLRTASKRNVVKVSNIELWKSTHNKKDNIIKTYTLPSY